MPLISRVLLVSASLVMVSSPVVSAASVRESATPEQTILPPAERVVSLSATAMPFQDAVQHLCTSADVGLELDIVAIENAGLKVDAPVTIDLKEIPLEKAVRRMLVSLHAVFTIGIELDDSRLLVSSREKMNARFVQNLPDWLRRLQNKGLVARLDSHDQITEVSVGDIADDELLVKLATLPKLKRLSISSSQSITGRGMMVISRMPELETLEFYSVSLSTESLALLRPLHGLRELGLRGAQLTDAGAAHLEGLKGLVVLRVGDNLLSDAGIEHLSGLANLEILEIPGSNRKDSGTMITDAGMPHLARLTKLRELNLSGLLITNAGFAHLSGLHKLRRLQLNNTRITCRGLEPLAGFPELESLSIGGPSFGDDGMENLGACKGLRHLELARTEIGDEGLRYVGTLDNLERLSFVSRFVTDAGLTHLASLNNLKHLELHASRITDESLLHLSGIASLTRLDLGGLDFPGVGRNFSETGYAYLAASPNLETFHLSNEKVAWTELRDFKKLKRLTLFSPDMSREDVHELQRALPDTLVSATSGGWSVMPIQYSLSIP